MAVCARIGVTKIESRQLVRSPSMQVNLVLSGEHIGKGPMTWLIGTSTDHDETSRSSITRFGSQLFFGYSDRGKFCGCQV